MQPVKLNDSSYNYDLIGVKECLNVYYAINDDFFFKSLYLYEFIEVTVYIIIYDISMGLSILIMSHF